MIGKPAMLYHL